MFRVGDLDTLRVEVDNILQHQHRLVERAIAIVCGESVLGQEVLSDNLGHLQVRVRVRFRFRFAYCSLGFRVTEYIHAYS